MTRRGFTLLEVMVAVVILAVGLSSLFTSEVGAIRIAQRARTTTVASLLARCKMGELEEKVAKEGWPATDTDGNDECCEGAERDGFSCEWSIKRIVLPEIAAEGEGGEEGGALDKLKTAIGGGEGDQAASAAAPAGPSTEPPDPGAAVGVPLTGGIESILGGGGGGDDEGAGDPIVSLIMSYAFPVMKPLIEEQVRRATVVVKWNEGSSEQTMDVVQYLVNELPMLAPDDDEEQDLSGQGGTSGSGGGGSGSGTGTGSKSPGGGSR